MTIGSMTWTDRGGPKKLIPAGSRPGHTKPTSASHAAPTQGRAEGPVERGRLFSGGKFGSRACKIGCA
jgi:hypothetical protein